MSDSTIDVPMPRSIHHQRRWFYVLWCTLLGVSLVALGFWLRPVAAGEGSMSFEFQVEGAPAEVTMSYWVGRGETPFGRGGVYQAAEGLRIPRIRIPILQRRWVRDIHPKAVRVVVVRFQSGSQSRFVLYDLKKDLRAKVMRDRRNIGIRVQFQWGALSDSESAPTELS